MVLPKEALILQFLAQFQDQLGYDDERVISGNFFLEFFFENFNF